MLSSPIPAAPGIGRNNEHLEMRPQQLMLPLAAAMFAAFAATIAFVVPLLAKIEESINVVVVADAVNLTRTTFVVAVAHALLLGLPLFLLVRRVRSHVGIVACVIGGFGVAASPFGILALISLFGVQTAPSDDQSTVVNGVPTLAFWVRYVSLVGLAGLLGVAGGLTFWVVMRPARSNAQSWRLISAAAVLTCGIFTLPVVVRDRSCHNLFRDGRTAVGPQVYADLKVPAEDWKKLKQIFADFGRAHALSIRGDKQVRDGRITWRGVDLCNDAGVSISIYDEPWLARMNSPLAEKGMKLSVFSLKPDADWKPLAGHLLGEIETIWPEKTTFRGPTGQILSFEDAMNGRP